MSAALTPAISSACTEAAAACVLRLSPAAMTCRRRMPVLVAIHSSLVSTSFSRSALLSTASGTLDPLPVILQPCRPCSLDACVAQRSLWAGLLAKPCILAATRGWTLRGELRGLLTCCCMSLIMLKAMACKTMAYKRQGFARSAPFQGFNSHSEANLSDQQPRDFN